LPTGIFQNAEAGLGVAGIGAWSGRDGNSPAVYWRSVGEPEARGEPWTAKEKYRELGTGPPLATAIYRRLSRSGESRRPG
jgi:hypothetical protein